MIKSWSWKGSVECGTRNKPLAVCRADTLLCLPCLTNCPACWCTPPSAQTEGCCRRPWRPLKEIQTSGALAPQTPCSHRRVSQLACQATAFVCPLHSPNHPREWTHPQRPYRWSEEGAGCYRECNSIAALCARHKGASESRGLGVRQPELCRHARVQQTWCR